MWIYFEGKSQRRRHGAQLYTPVKWTNMSNTTWHMKRTFKQSDRLLNRKPKTLAVPFYALCKTNRGACTNQIKCQTTTTTKMTKKILRNSHFCCVQLTGTNAVFICIILLLTESEIDLKEFLWRKKKPLKNYLRLWDCMRASIFRYGNNLTTESE